MKTLFATLLIVTAASNVNAEGFYGQVVDQTNRAALAAQETAGPSRQVNEEALQQVISDQREHIKSLGETGENNGPAITFTPLYEKVKGIV